MVFGNGHRALFEDDEAHGSILRAVHRNEESLVHSHSLIGSEVRSIPLTRARGIVASVTSAERKAISEEWRKVGENALDAANELLSAGHHRSSVGRSYYAAYSFLAAILVLESSVAFRDDREGPEHEPLSDLVAVHLRRAFPSLVRSRVRVGIRSLYALRLLADYRSRAAIDDALARRSVQIASTIANNVRNIVE